MAEWPDALALWSHPRARPGGLLRSLPAGEAFALASSDRAAARRRVRRSHPEIAHVLASHYEQGQVLARALHYYVVAGERTARRFSNPVMKLPETRSRTTPGPTVSTSISSHSRRPPRSSRVSARSPTARAASSRCGRATSPSGCASSSRSPPRVPARCQRSSSAHSSRSRGWVSGVTSSAWQESARRERRRSPSSSTCPTSSCSPPTSR